MTRAVIRFVLCGAVVCLTAAVIFAQTSTTTRDQEISGHRSRWQHSSLSDCPRARGN